MIYEYAGFIFNVDSNGKLMAAPGQHQAAYKEKHRMNAQECYDQEKRK